MNSVGHRNDWNDDGCESGGSGGGCAVRRLHLLDAFSVHFDVRYQTVLAGEALVAVLAREGFARVTTLVRHEVTLAREVLRALVALEWSHRRVLVVRPHVEQQVALERERLAALGARVRPLACVAAHVVHEVLLHNNKISTRQNTFSLNS